MHSEILSYHAGGRGRCPGVRIFFDELFGGTN